jgi:tricorn protease
MRYFLALFTLTVAISCTLLVPLHADTTRFLQHPTISPDGSEIVFSWGGDLWRVSSEGGVARQITIHPAHDYYPLYSPDGASIVFSSAREGTNSVFMVSPSGGTPRRLTYHNSSSNYAYSFSGDGSELFFTTNRFGTRSLMRLPLAGGTPSEISAERIDSQFFPAVNEKANRVVFCRRSGPSAVQRMKYRGSNNVDLWMAKLDTAASDYVQLTSNTGQDIWPALSPNGKTLYWISAREGSVPNIYKMQLPPTSPDSGVAITNFKTDAIRSMRLSQNGKWLVFVHNFGIYRMSTAPGAKPEKVGISIPDAPIGEHIRHRAYNSSGVGDYAVSPDGKKAVLIVDHDLYLTSTDDNPTTRQITDTPTRESQVAWASDSQKIVYATMKNGQRDLAIYDFTSNEEDVLTDTEGDESHPSFSPDMQHLAYLDANQHLVVVSYPTREEELRIELAYPDATMQEDIFYDWSPDSNWLVYRQYEPNSSYSATAHSLDGTGPLRLSPVIRYITAPSFTGTGDAIVYGGVEGENVELYMVEFEPRPEEFPENDFDKLFKKPEKKDEEKDKKDKDKKKKIKPPETKIDMKDLEDRTYVLKNFGDNHRFDMDGVAHPDGKRLIIAQPDGIYSMDLTPKKRGRLTKLISGKYDDLQVTRDGKSLFYSSRRTVYKLSLSTKKAVQVKFSIDRNEDSIAKRDAAYEEAWWALERHFYDPNLHGVDWDAVKVKYAALLPHVKGNRAFADMLQYMLGELNASHMGAYAHGSKYYSHSPSSGYLGLRFDPSALHEKNRLVVSSIIPRSPATKPQSELYPGEEILAIDGKPVVPETNFFKSLNGVTGKRFTLRLRSATSADVTREISLKPVSSGSMRGLRYSNWVKLCRQRVEEWSDGKLGYMHVKAMDAPSMDTFWRDLRKRLAGKQGAIIDVRNNGGGWISFRLLSVLARKPWSYTQIRHHDKVSQNWWRGYSLEMPAACLINQHSFSNAEMFAEGFRNLDLGPVIGYPTGGGVIGTGSFTLINRFVMRMPRVGVYSSTGENLEGAGRQPDILVDIAPDQGVKDEDPQLKRAVGELLKTLDSKQ